jgi:hypothetical protein
MRLICIALLLLAAAPALADRASELRAAESAEAMVAMVIDSPKADIKTYHHDGGFAVTYSLNPWLLTVGTARAALLLHTQELVPALFDRLSDIDTVIIEAHARMIDVKGNEREERVAWVAFSRENSASIRWDNINPHDIPAIADGAWLSRALKE